VVALLDMNAEMRSVIERIKATEDCAREAQRWRLYEADQINIQWPQFWASVIRSSTETAAEFNAAFTTDNSKHITVEGSEHSLVIRKAYFPALRVEATIQPTARRIDYTLSEMANPYSDAITQTNILELSVGSDGKMYAQRGEIAQDISDRLLTLITDRIQG
jgi:hypothetical protein